jgi:hypothetical protein
MAIALQAQTLGMCSIPIVALCIRLEARHIAHSVGGRPGPTMLQPLGQRPNERLIANGITHSPDPSTLRGHSIALVNFCGKFSTAASCLLSLAEISSN